MHSIRPVLMIRVGPTQSPAVARGTVYVRSKDRKVHALDATTGNVR